MSADPAVADDGRIHDYLWTLGEIDYGRCAGKLCDSGLPFLHGWQHLLELFFYNLAGHFKYVSK